MAGANITLKWNKPIKQIVKDATGGKDLMLFAAQTWHRLFTPFVPMDTGMLALTQVQYEATENTAKIIHTAPYAARQYEGVSFNFRKDRHPLASAQWDQAARQAGKGAQLAREMQAFIDRGG